MKKIIVLSKTSNGIITNYNFAFWFSITSGAQPETSGSVWTGASGAENTAIQNGSVVEEIQGFAFPTGISPTYIKALVDQYWVNRNAQINSVGANQYYGVFEDSVTGWSA